MKVINTLQIGDDWITDRAGGLNQYLYELLRHLPSTNTRFTGLVVAKNSLRESTQGKVVAFAKPDSTIVTRLFSLRQAAFEAMRKDKVDLIASHFALYGSAITDKFSSIPMVQHFHGPWAGESGTEGSANLNTRLKWKVESTVYSRARRLIVLSRAFGDELVTRYGVSEERVRIIPGGVDISRFNMDSSRAAARKRLGWPTDRPIILAVRRLVRRMGLEILIEACRILKNRHPDVLVLLGGSGPNADVLKSKIVEWSLEDNIRLLGRVSDEDLPYAYRAADMTVVPSQALEGFGLITIESLASGTPVFVTPVGGLPETIGNFAPQCIFRDTSAVEMAAVLADTLSGQSRRPSDDACRRYAENFAWPHVAGRVRAVYDEALA